MPYRRKDSLVWWASLVGPGGKRVRRSTGTTDRKEAEAIESKWKAEVYQHQMWDKEPERSFEEVMLLFLQEHRHKRSAGKDDQHARRLRRSFGGRIMNELAPADIRGYIVERQSEGVSPASINRELALLSAAINYANVEQGWNLRNPVKGRKLREPEGRVRWITRAEAVALAKAAESEVKAPHLADFITLALHTGMRRGEMLGLEWRRVDLQGGLVYLEAEHTKAAKRRSVPLNDAARSALLRRARFRAEHCPASPWVFALADGTRIKDMKRSFATACRRAGIRDFRIHDMRHTCAAWLVTAGVPLTEVRDLLGHSTVKVTERYAHLAPENLRAAVGRLDEVRSRFGHGVQDKGLSIAS